jgi:FkbH-like protein
LKLIDALKIVRQGQSSAAPLRVALLMGASPLHLKTFLHAHLQQHSPERRVEIETGRYGDLAGSLERVDAAVSAVAVVIEWPDLDPRLGLRSSGGWGPAQQADILRGLPARLTRLRSALQSSALPIALAPPTLPLPPLGPTSATEAGSFELELRAQLLAFLSAVAAYPTLVVMSAAGLALDGHDVKGELIAGFPYRLAHAAALGERLARLLLPPQPKKGLVTDLDDTLWSGLLGEVGASEVSWDLDHGSQLHALYQQLLRGLAESGVLLGVASKNDPALVAEAFARRDMVLPAAHVFPIEAGWGAKSQAVARILQAWNIAAESVVFVDDSAMELAEVAAAHPGIEAVHFPKGDDAVYALLHRLRELFAKRRVLDEDRLRTSSMRAAAPLKDATGDAAALERFLEAAEAEIEIDASRTPDPRAFELVSKTSQFNLNGRRPSEGQWRAALQRPDAFQLVCSYRDRYGPLGKIAVVSGHSEGARAVVDTWVMSCRAFSRRIEHRCLEQVFELTGAREVVFEYESTERNAPLRLCLESLLHAPPTPRCALSRADFVARCPRLYDRTAEAQRG